MSANDAEAIVFTTLIICVSVAAVLCAGTPDLLDAIVWRIRSCQ